MKGIGIGIVSADISGGKKSIYIYMYNLLTSLNNRTNVRFVVHVKSVLCSFGYFLV